jgi:hypothetical protein
LMPAIARDAVASDHLVYAWPFPIGPEEHDVSCAEDELVVMCPAWLVGDRLGPGRHRWRTPDPTRPVSAYFVLTAPVEVSFDMITQFIMPANGQPVRLRATGSLSVRCMDPALLVAQFVGLPFDAVNDGVLRSVSRSMERMLARLLTRRVVMAGTPVAVTDPNMLPNIIEELIAYNPTAGAVFGVELMRIGHLAIAADDGSRSWEEMFRIEPSQADTKRRPTPLPIAPEPGLLETVRGTAPKTPEAGQKSRTQAGTLPPPPTPKAAPTPPKGNPQVVASGEIVAKPARAPTPPPTAVSGEIGGSKPPAVPTPMRTEVSGEIGGSKSPPPTKKTSLGHAVPGIGAEASGSMGAQSGGGSSGPQRPTIPSIPPIPAMPPPVPSGAKPPPIPQARRAEADDGAFGAADAPTLKHDGKNRTPVPGSLQPPSTMPTGSSPGTSPLPSGRAAATSNAQAVTTADGTPLPDEPRGSIMGIGMSHIGSSELASGEITKKIAPGGRVLVPGPNGLMQSATVRQLLQGYYELEVGGSGETIWVPVSGVVPE